MFTPVESALGAILLQQASTALLFNNGCVLGASGQLRGILTGPTFKTSAFIAGMALSVFVTKTIFPTLIPHYDVPQQDWNDSLWIVGLGTLTGYGTKVRRTHTYKKRRKTSRLTHYPLLRRKKKYRAAMVVLQDTCCAASVVSRLDL